jgi:hypothetical protein
MSETVQAPLVTRTDLIAKVAESMKDGPKQRLYKSDRKSMQVCTDKGKVVVFVAGLYFTADEEIIAYLDREIKAGMPGISYSQEELYFDPEKYDPMAKLRKQVRAELLAEMARAAGNPERDMGSYEQARLNPSNTTNIAPTAAGNGPNAIAFQSVKK